jgi:hypothetical protein
MARSLGKKLIRATYPPGLLPLKIQSHTAIRQINLTRESKSRQRFPRNTDDLKQWKNPLIAYSANK